MKDLNQEFKEIIKFEISPILKDFGFKKKANNFNRQVNDIVQVFTVQQSQWNTHDGKSFTFNIGIYNNDIYSECFERELPSFPKEYDCILSLRIGTISKGLDSWYSLKQRTDIVKLKTEIKTDIQNHVIPFFNTYDKLISLNSLYEKYEVLKAQSSSIMRIAFLLKTNQMVEGRSILLDAYKANMKPRRSKTTIKYPDGRSEEKWSEPYYNTGYLNFLRRVAAKYSIEIPKENGGQE